MFSQPNPFESFQATFNEKTQNILQPPQINSNPFDSVFSNQPSPFPQFNIMTNSQLSFQQNVAASVNINPQKQQSANTIDIIPKPFINQNSIKQLAHPGEVIPSRCFVYHSISELATKIDEQQALSINLHTRKAKAFQHKNQTIIALMQGESDLQLLINQQDQIQNILSSFHQAGTLTGLIIDFTIVNNQTLYLLYQQHVIVVDISQLTNSKVDGLPQLVDQIAIQGPFNRIDTAYDDQYLVLIHKNKAQILQINLKTSEQFTYKIENEDQRVIRDVNINKGYICILFDKNEVAVFDVNHKQRVFRSVFRDATAQVTRLFYIKDFEDDVDYNDEIEEEYSRFKDDEVVNDKPRLFQGYFLFVENQIVKTQKSIVSSSGSKDMKPATKTNFEKICLVKVINNVSAGKIQKQTSMTQKSQPQEQQSLHSQDFLKISEKTAKLVEYNEKRGILFLLNQEKPSQNMSLYSIKLKIADDHDSDSDGGRKAMSADGFKFWFIKEMRLNLNYSIIQAINTASGHRKPKFLKVVRRPATKQHKEEFYIYVAIGSQVLCYVFDYIDFIPNDQNIKQYAEGGASSDINFHQPPIMNNGSNLLDQLMMGSGAQKNQVAFQESLFDQDYFLSQDPGIIIAPPKSQTPSGNLIFSNNGSNDNKNSNSPQIVFNDQEFQQTQSYLEKILKMEYPSMEDDLIPPEDQLQNDQNAVEIDEEYKAQQEQVKQEMAKAIEDVLKDDNILQPTQNLMIEEELKNESNLADGSQLNPELVLKISEESKQSTNSQQEANTNAQATKTIGGNEQPQTQAPTAGGKKKKNKNKNKNNAAANGTQNVQQNSSAQSQNLNQTQQTQQNQTQIVQQQQSQTTLNNQASGLLIQPATQITNLLQFQQNPQPVIQQFKPFILNNPNSLNSASQNNANQSSLNNQGVSSNNIVSNNVQSSGNAQNNQQNAQTQKKQQKTPQEQMIENYQELTRKYQDLAQKISSMQRQVQNQSNQQIEIDKSIQKNIKAVLPGIIQQQLLESVVPEMVKNIKSVDRQIKEHVMPQVENQIQDIFSKLIDNGLASQNANNSKVQQQKQNADRQSQSDSLAQKSLDEKQIRNAIMHQFDVAMNQQIKPMLENQLKQVVESAQSSLLFANMEFENRLRQEEEKNKQIMELYISKLNQIMEAQSKVNNPLPQSLNRSFKQARPLGSPVMYPGYVDMHIPPTPPYHHNPYYPPMQYMPQGQVPYMHDMSYTIPKDMQRNASYNNQFNPQAFFSGPAQFQIEQPIKQNIERRISSRLVPNSDDEEDNDIEDAVIEENKNSDSESGLPDDMDENTRQQLIQYRQQVKRIREQNILLKQNSQVKQQISPILNTQFIPDQISQSQINPIRQSQISNIMTANGQTILMFNEDEIIPMQGRSSNKIYSKDSSFISNLNMQPQQQSNTLYRNSNTNKKNQNSSMKQKQISKTQQIQQQVQPQPILATANQTKPTKQSSKGKGGEFEHILTFFKSIANGQPKQLDQLYKNKPFLIELNNFLKNNIQELSVLHQNIISQFMKKIHDRSMLDDATQEYKKEGLKIFNRLNSRICKQREDMKQVLPKIQEMEKALKDQIQD